MFTPKNQTAVCLIIPALLILAGCATTKTETVIDSAKDANKPIPVVAQSTGTGVGGGPLPKRSLNDFKKSNVNAPCYDRKNEPFTPVVDSHFHPRPFGGKAITPPELYRFFDEAGVRFVNYYGIGQVLELKSECTYYLDCPGVNAEPSVKNDFVNGMEVTAYKHENLNIVLSMTFMDISKRDDILKTIKMYDKEFPGMFKWAGELNVVKAALTKNGHTYVTPENIAKWAPFMKVLRERNIPVTLHSDLGNDANPTLYLPLMQKVLATYPNNKIVWAHMGLSKELTKMNPDLHVSIMKKILDQYPNLYLDISWDVLYESYRDFGPIFIKFFNENPDRILPGTDFVAAGHKEYKTYANELDLTSRVLKYVNDDAFRQIALGENYFKLLGLDYQAPQVCPSAAN